MHKITYDISWNIMKTMFSGMNFFSMRWISWEINAKLLSNVRKQISNIFGDWTQPNIWRMNNPVDSSCWLNNCYNVNTTYFYFIYNFSTETSDMEKIVEFMRLLLNIVQRFRLENKKRPNNSIFMLKVKTNWRSSQR